MELKDIKSSQDILLIMREIKYKGIRLDNKELIYGSLISQADVDGIVKWYSIKEISFPESKPVRIYPQSISEYTGIKDKFDQEIYEDDRIKYNDDLLGDPLGEYSFIYEIYWHEDYLQWWVDGGFQFDHCALCELVPDYITLIK